jgi:hypothetical protein
MKRFLVLACALALSAPALAQLYKWVDKDGRVTYSDQPPAAQASKQLNIGTGTTGPATAAPRSALERDKELEKGRLQAKEKAEVAANIERKAEVDRENCNRAKAYLRTVTDGGRIATSDSKGEPILLDDEQIAVERVKAQKMVDEACKPS